MSYCLHFGDYSVPYCASLEAWNRVLAGQHLNVSHPRSSIWPSQAIFSHLKNFKVSYLPNC